MTALTAKHFDTLGYVQRSKELGVTEPVAEYQARQIEQSIEIAVSTMRTEIEEKECTTQNDISSISRNVHLLEGKIYETEQRLETKIHETEQRLEIKIHETEQRLEGKIHQTELRLEAKIHQTELRLEEKIQQSEHRLEGKIRESELRLEKEITQTNHKTILWMVGLFVTSGFAQHLLHLT